MRRFQPDSFGEWNICGMRVFPVFWYKKAFQNRFQFLSGIYHIHQKSHWNLSKNDRIYPPLYTSGIDIWKAIFRKTFVQSDMYALLLIYFVIRPYRRVGFSELPSSGGEAGMSGRKQFWWHERRARQDNPIGPTSLAAAYTTCTYDMYLLWCRKWHDSSNTTHQ